MLMVGFGQSGLVVGFRNKAGPEWMREVAPTVLETCYKDGGELVFLFGSKASEGERKEG